jgi:alkanesulfonate monooxygenase SsuD/methylene tetrahydromethanopterin reductase-like flavin-dependent oxidoreductase (luciferase family)
MYLMRFDMRAPQFGATTSDLYRTALDMAAWGESRGVVLVVLSEHHCQDDGYLPSPLVFAAALASRTTTLPILMAALILPLYDPIRLAEDMVVLDIISGGRVSYVVALGYVPREFEHYGADFRRRGRLVEEQLQLLLRAKTGEPFEHEGRRIHVTPAPVTPGGPSVAWGGGSSAAAERAGRLGLDFFAQGGDPGLEAVYARAARDHGHAPGACMVPATDMATTVFVAHDLDEAWHEVGPHLLHDVTSYAALNEGRTNIVSLSRATTIAELRAENRSHRIVTVDEAVELIRSGHPLPLQPLVGGLPPEIAWRYLRIVGEEVMARLVD